MKGITKFFHAFAYELIGLLIFSIVTVLLFAINQVAGFVALAAVVIYSIVLLVLFKMGKYGFARDIDGNGIAQMIAGLTEKIDSPVMVVNENNKIVWSNDEFNSLTEVSAHHISSGMGSLFGSSASYTNLEETYDKFADYLTVKTHGSEYRVRPFPINFHKQKLFGTIWYSKDEEAKLKKEKSEQSLRVAYIIADNTSEVGQVVQDSLKFGSATLNELLNEWVGEINGILTEYEHDKYVMLFENKYLQSMIDSKFEILDKVYQKTAKQSTVPMTISIGISDIVGTLNDKKEQAQNALDAALKHGGCLAVVKTSHGEDKYGGRNKAAQRQTKIRSRMCTDLLVEQLSSCSNVIIMGHSRPDFDSIASNIGISKIVQKFKKDYCIVVDKHDKSISKIIEMIDRFPEYDSVFVDEVYAQEQLTPETLVIITDVSNPDIFAARGIYENASKVIVIDHHAVNKSLDKQVFKLSNIDPTASSASELVCEMLEMTMKPNDLKVEEAQILLAGILLDTQFFSRDTGTRTYSACIFLKNAGADVSNAKNLFKSTMYEIKTVQKIEQDMIVYRDKYAISIFDENDNAENKVIASKAAERFVDIDGIAASFVIYRLREGMNLSARSDGTVNVINIAKLLGGGGHFQSAGATFKKIIENKSSDDSSKDSSNRRSFGEVITNASEAEVLLKNAIDEYIGSEIKEVIV